MKKRELEWRKNKPQKKSAAKTRFINGEMGLKGDAENLINIRTI